MSQTPCGDDSARYLYTTKYDTSSYVPDGEAKDRTASSGETNITSNIQLLGWMNTRSNTHGPAITAVIPG